MSDARTFLGVMSGTSCDGVDAVAVRLHGGPAGQAPVTVEILAHEHAPYEVAFRARLLALSEARSEEIARLHVELGQRFGKAACSAIARAGIEAAEVVAIGSPGHTAVHLPPTTGDPGATLALGDGDVIAEWTGCPVLSDVRARDRAAGGQGAPLVPFADACLLRTPGRTRAALNLGGIGNLTVVPPEGPPMAFDTGPGNMLLDGALARATSGELSMDAGGALGREGSVDEAWLREALAADEFLSMQPPRSTGRERYGSAFLDVHWTRLGVLSVVDLAATLAAYTVECVARSMEQFLVETPDELVVSGGGAFNACLMTGLAERLAPMKVVDSESALGLPVLAREAVSFALLADATLAEIPGNVPGVTGARRAVLLGKLSYGR